MVLAGRRFFAGVWVVAVAPAGIEAVLRADLGEARLEQLEVPLLPVATNLSRARAELFAAGPLASAVRASCSLPALFGATSLPTGLYVDGMIAENLPVPLAEHAGCDLVIGSNALPPPRVDDRGAPRRLRDLGSSLSLMLHCAGRHAPSPRRVLYDGPAQDKPLFGAVRWERADEILAAARADDGLAAAIERSASAWRSLASS
jgi:predicted acylesterase/phospholipase RssA